MVMRSDDGAMRAHDPEEASFLRLAEAYREEGLFEDAIRICRDGLAKCPNSLWGRLLLGQTLLERGALGEALVELGRVEREAQGDAEILSLLRTVRMPSPPRTAEGERSAEESGPSTEPGVLYLDDPDRPGRPEGDASAPDGALLTSPTLAELYSRQGDQATADAILERIERRQAPVDPGGAVEAGAEASPLPSVYLDDLHRFQKGLRRLRADRDPRRPTHERS
jgi:tetratricopeptide (TPR) repeat protein